MALTTQERNRVARQFMRECSNRGLQPLDVTKPQIANAVASLDDHMDTIAAAINSALPAAFRNNATVGQKALLLTMLQKARGQGE